MAQEFRYDDPLAGIKIPDPLIEEEEDQKDPEQPIQEKTAEDFNWINPLKGIGSPTNLKLRAAEIAAETTVKPIMAYNFEAGQRYPDAFFETLRYTMDAARDVPANLIDRSKIMWESWKEQAAEDAFSQLKGETTTQLPISAGGGYDHFGQAFMAKRYAEMSEEEKLADEKEMQGLRRDTQKAIADINKKINKRQSDSNLGEYGRTVSSGLESMAVITTAMVANGLSGGRLTAPTATTTLGYFGLQTQAVSYAEAKRQGKDHKTSLAYGNIQGLLEVGTEALPVFRYLRPVGNKTAKEIMQNGFVDVATDTSMEVINGVLQEVNTAMFDLESDLRTAYDNRNNPLYEGPSMAQVLQDVAGHSFLASLIASGSISSIRTTGEVMYSPEITNYIKQNKDNPALNEFIENFNAMVNNSSLNYEAIDKATINILDPNYTSGVTAEELLADSFLNTNFIRLEDPVEGRIAVEKQEGIVNQVNEKFPENFKDFSFIDPLSKETKQVKNFIVGEEMKEDSKAYNQTVRMQFEETKGLPENSIIRNDTYNQDELDIVRNRIIFPRRFHEGTLKNIPEFGQLPREIYTRRLGNTRDLSLDESNNLSKATIDLLNMGMPLDIFTDLRYIGVESVDPQEGVQAFGVYEPATQSIALNPFIGLKTSDYTSQLGAKTQLTHTFVHELSHHIDFGLGRDMKSSYQIYTPASSTSPLFNIPNLNNIDMVADGSNLLQITDPDGGAVMMEALNIHINKPQAHHEGAMLRYPLSQLMSYFEMNTLNENLMSTIKAETFAQMYSLYYTNRDFLRENAPETFALIERLNDAISVDSLREKNARVLQAFQSSRAPRSIEVPPRRGADISARSVDQEQQPTSELEVETTAEDRDRIRSELPKIVGAPPGVDNQRKVGALRRKVKGLVKEGEPNRFWYEESSKAILDITNNNIEDADKLAQAIAITSPSTSVDVNTTFALQAYYQYKAGQPIETGRYPQEMSKKLEQAFGGQEWKGKKTDKFYNNLMRVIDPSRAQGVTVDLWMMRLFGYGKDTVNITEYRFVEEEINKIADEIGWEPQQVQAAAWVAGKAREEGTEVVEAGFNFSDAIQKNLGQISTETIPGRTNNHMNEMFEAPYEQVQEYHVNASKAILDQDGNDIIAQRLGILSPGMFEAPGYYEGKLSPGTQIEIAVPQARKTKDQVIQPEAEDLIKAYASVYGILFKQDAVGYHKPFYQTNIPKSKRNIHEARIGRQVTNEEIQSLADAMEKVSGKNYLNPIPAPKGVRFINFAQEDGINNIQFSKLVDKVLNEVELASNIEVIEAGSALGYVTNDWSQNKNGENYPQTSLEGRPDLQEKVRDIVRELQPRIDEVDTTLSEKYGWTRDESINSIYRDPGITTTRIERRIQEPVDLSETVQVPDIGSMLTKGDSSFLFRQYSNIQELAVDKLDRLKGFMGKLKPYLPEGMKDLDIIRSTDTFYGKVKTKLDDAVKEVDGLLKFLKSSNIKEAEFNQFLKNLHAPERNKFINSKYEQELPGLRKQLEEETDAKRIPVIKGQITKRENVLNKYKDSGSGISTDQAVTTLNEMGIEYNPDNDVAKPSNEMGKNLLKAFDILNAYQNKTRQSYIENDLVSEETVADWNANYQYYVPLVGFAVDTIDSSKPEPKGGGRSLYGSIIPEAKGRKSEAGNPLEQAILRRSEAAVLGERNEINKELASLVRQFPSKNIWDIKGAQRFEKPHKWDGEKSLIPFKEEGKTKFLVIKDERLARGLDEFGNQTMNPFIRLMRGITSTLSALYTSYSPEFVVTNFTRDYQTGYFNLLAEKEIADGRALGKQLKGALNPKSMVKTLRELRHGYVTDRLKETDPEAFKYFRAFLENGGQTGYVNAKDVDQIQKEMLTLSKAHDGIPLNPVKIFNSTARFVESVNNVAENASRFAVFKSFVKESGGIDKASKTDIANAANLAKNLTINFNRSGRLGPYVNAFYVFANAAVQGNVNFFRGMVPFRFDSNGKMKYQPISKAKKYVMSGGVGFGGLVALYNTLVSGEDEDGKLFIDKIPQHEQERNLIIMLPGVKRSRGKPVYDRETRTYKVNGKPVAVTIPLPYGYNIFFNMGRMGMETATKDIAGYERRSGVEFAKDISGIAVGAFSPVGIAYSGESVDLGKTAVPSFIKPVFDVYINEKWTGAPVYKEQYFGSKLPISSTKLKNTEEFYRDFTKMLNQVDLPALGIEGGGEADPGSINISPDVIKYLLQSYLGGMYTTAERSYNGIEKAVDVSQGINRDVTLNEIPFGRIFTAEPENYTDAIEFYRYKELLRGTPDKPGKGLVTSYKSYMDKGDKKGLEDFKSRRNFKNEYLVLDKKLSKFETQLRKLNERERLAEKLKDKDRLKYFDIINDIERKRNELHQEFNKLARPIIGRD